MANATEQSPPADETHAKFLSTLSHDLRGAANGVQLALEMLRRSIDANQPPERMMEDIDLGRRAAMDVAVRLERLITAERLRLGVMPLRRHKGDLIEVIRAAVNQSLVSAPEADERVVLNLPSTWIIEADLRLLGETIGGLLDHALRTRHQGKIKVAADPAKSTLQISVDGPWLSTEEIALLTSMRPPSKPTKFDPADIGLFIAVQCRPLLGVTFDARKTASSQGLLIELPLT